MSRTGRGRYGRGQTPGVLSGLGLLLRLQVRTGRWGLLAWLVGLAALVAAIAASIDGLFPTVADRATYAATVGDSVATQALNGRAYAADTLGGITAYEVGFLGQLLFPVAGLAVALRHTRREEETGRAELVAAGRVSPLAPLGVGAALVTGVSVGAALLIWAAGVAVGLPSAGTAWYAASVASVVAFFGAVGLGIAQLVQHTRSGWALGLGAVAVCYLGRVLVDGMQWSATWLSPLGWYVEVRAYTDDPRIWPFVAYGVGIVLLVAAAVAVRSRRDLGAGVVTPRLGPTGARPWTATPVGLAWRLTRGSARGWIALAVVVAAVFGTLAEEMASLVEDNPAMLDALGVDGGSDLVMRMGILVAVIAACAAAVQGVNRLGEEESSDRLGLVLATRIPRPSLWGGWLLVVAANATAVVMAGGVALGTTVALTTSDVGALGRSVAAAAGYLVPVLALVALTAALRAVRPPMGAAAWVAVGWVMVVAFLSDALGLPGWATNLSPVHLVGDLPMTDLSVPATATLAVFTLGAVAVSLQAFARRDLRAT